MVVHAVLAKGAPAAAMASACERLVGAGYGFVDGSWARVSVEIPPARTSGSGEKWGSVRDAVNTTRDWRACAGPAEPQAFWSAVAAVPAFVDVANGRPEIANGTLELFARPADEETALRLAVEVCKAAQSAGLNLRQVSVIGALERTYSSTERLRGRPYSC